MASALDRLKEVFEHIDATLAERVSMRTARFFYEHLKVIVYKGGRGGKAVHSFTCNKPSHFPSRIVEAFSGLPSTLIPRFDLEDHAAPYRIAVMCGNIEIFIINTRMSKNDTHLNISNIHMPTLEKDILDAAEWVQLTVPAEHREPKVELDRQGEETLILHRGYRLKGVVLLLENEVTGEVTMQTV